MNIINSFMRNVDHWIDHWSNLHHVLNKILHCGDIGVIAVKRGRYLIQWSTLMNCGLCQWYHRLWCNELYWVLRHPIILAADFKRQKAPCMAHESWSSDCRFLVTSIGVPRFEQRRLESWVLPFSNRGVQALSWIMNIFSNIYTASTRDLQA